MVRCGGPLSTLCILSSAALTSFCRKPIERCDTDDNENKGGGDAQTNIRIYGADRVFAVRGIGQRWVERGEYGLDTDGDGAGVDDDAPRSVAFLWWPRSG